MKKKTSSTEKNTFPLSLTALARLAQVTKSTVSRALSDHPSVSEATKKKIRALADQHGYAPSPLLQSVMTQIRQHRLADQTPTLAYLNLVPREDDLIKFTTSRKFWEGAQEQCRERGFSLDYFWIGDPKMTPKQILRILRTRRITGAILRASSYTTSQLDPWIESLQPQVHLVTVGFKVPGRALPFSTNDQYQSVRLALDQLLRRGYERIGMVGRSSIEKLIEYRFVGGYIAQQMQTCRQPQIPPLLLTNEPEAYPRDLTPWLTAHRPDVLLVTDADIARWITHTYPDKKKRPSLVLLDHHEEHSAYAGINQHNEVVGASAAYLVINHLLGQKAPASHGDLGLTIESTWQEGSSLPAKADTVKRSKRISKNSINTPHAAALI
jgi:DNA-binding LacI/PurR family transcriptional regulator